MGEPSLISKIKQQLASWASLIVETYCQYSTKVVQKRKISLEGKKKEEKKKKGRKSN